MADRPAFHRQIRLARSAYAQPGAVCAVTIAVQGRRPVFDDKRFAKDAVNVLRNLVEHDHVSVFGYCVMPDHVHLVLEPGSESDIVSFVARYKSLVQRSLWSLGLSGTFWQKSFWDHFLRGDEAVGHVVQYVLNNPVRKGMVADWKDYPFSGSLVWDLR